MLYCTSRKPEELWIARISSQNVNLPTALVRLMVHLESVQNHSANTLAEKV